MASGRWCGRWGSRSGRIVIDAGHGGHDSGTLGPGGIQEKDVVLDVALRVGKLLHDRLGAEIVYTRYDDTFIPLETRTAIANKAQADLFLSIHANSSPEPSARGVETYYLNFTSDPDALDVAARENAVSSNLGASALRPGAQDRAQRQDRRVARVRRGRGRSGFIPGSRRAIQG